MPRSGTLVICVQNLDYSGANQVVLNIVTGRMHESNVIVLSPKVGAFAARFIDGGAAIRVGDLANLLVEIRDVFCIICNTIMTASIVVEMTKRPQPVVWILHEWWTDAMITENLAIRNMVGLNLGTVKEALCKASMVVFVCEAQRRFYNPKAPSTVIYVGVPAPLSLNNECSKVNIAEPQNEYEFAEKKVDIMRTEFDNCPFTFLCLGIVCPRKNQIWAVNLFKKFAGDRQDMRLQIVGARHTRHYEIEYLNALFKEIGNDPRIEIHDVTDNVNQFYEIADCLLFTSKNEVTPMVISEAMSWGIPILATDIAGIPEMLTDGQEGFIFPPGDDFQALSCMSSIVDSAELRKNMGRAGRARFATTFDLDIMIEKYRQLLLTVAPPVVLVDMDGTLVDWDRGFVDAWANRSVINREISYCMEDCVEPSFRQEALQLMMTKGFFENLLPMPGGVQALREMDNEGLKVYICTTPLLTSPYCAQEKLDWIRNHLGENWVDKVILCQDKSVVRGDLLIDDRPYDFLSPCGRHTTATWKQVIFDAPYNRQKNIPRLSQWKDWRHSVWPLLGKLMKDDPYIWEFGEPLSEVTERMSPRNKRNRVRRSAKAHAQAMQVMLLPYPCELLSPENVASITGTGSLFIEDPDLQEADAYSSDGSKRSPMPEEVNEDRFGNGLSLKNCDSLGTESAPGGTNDKVSLFIDTNEESNETKKTSGMDQQNSSHDIQNQVLADGSVWKCYREGYRLWRERSKCVLKKDTR